MSKRVVVAAFAGLFALAGGLVAGEARADTGAPIVLAQAQGDALDTAVDRAAERAARRAARREARQAGKDGGDRRGGGNEARWTLTPDGLGPLNANTTYGSDFGWLGRRFEVEETSVDAGVVQLPARTFLNKQGKVVIEAVFAEEDGPLDEIRILRGKFRNSEGHALRQPFAEIFPNGAGEDCGPGIGTLTGMVVCWEPGVPNLGLVFGRPNKPFAAGHMPRPNRLAKMKVRYLLWRAPATAPAVPAPPAPAAKDASAGGAGGSSGTGATRTDAAADGADTRPARRRAHGGVRSGAATDADSDGFAMDGETAFDSADGDMMDDMDGDAEAMNDMLDLADGDMALDPAESAAPSDTARVATTEQNRPAGSAPRSAAASLGAIRTTELLRTTTTVLGAPLMLPRESMVDFEVRSAMVELDPGADTGWHEHTVPTYAHILDGALEVTYRTDAGDEVKLYRPGDTFMEAEGVVHRGRVASDGDGVRLIEVIMAAPTLETTIAVTN